MERPYRIGRRQCGPRRYLRRGRRCRPDVVWISKALLIMALQPDGKLHAAPELMIEVLSPGITIERRDREAKLKLYSQRGVQEYWVADWRRRQVEIYRREQAALRLLATLYEHDTLQ